MMERYQVDQLKDMRKWSDEDATLSAYEGWCISNTSKNNIVICKLDLAYKFESDDEATLYVMDQFLNGSALAAKAIKYILNGEYENV